MLVLPANIYRDPEFVGVITEALSAESYKQVTPAVYDTLFEYVYLRDGESFTLYNKIRASTVFDFNWIFGDGNKLAYLISGTAGAGNTNLSSYFATNYAACQAGIDAIYDNIHKNYVKK